MNKEEYFNKSRTSKCQTIRCPITNYCTRRALTIYYFSDFRDTNISDSFIPPLLKAGIVPDDFEKNSIPLQSAAPVWSKSNNLLYYENVCPEVNLFETEHSLPFSCGTASTNGEWDNDRLNKFKNKEYGHFSECAEYNHYLANKRRYNTSSKTKRSRIPGTLKLLVFNRDKHTCQYCGRTVADGAKLSLDHKISYSLGGKDTIENLTTACMDCNRAKGNMNI